MVRVDEMATICSGANFLLTNIVEESFLYDKTHYVFQVHNVISNMSKETRISAYNFVK